MHHVLVCPATSLWNAVMDRELRLVDPHHSIMCTMPPFQTPKDEILDQDDINWEENWEEIEQWEDNDDNDRG